MRLESMGAGAKLLIQWWCGTLAGRDSRGCEESGKVGNHRVRVRVMHMRHINCTCIIHTILYTLLVDQADQRQPSTRTIMHQTEIQ